MQPKNHLYYLVPNTANKKPLKSAMPSGLLLTLGNQKFPNVNKKHTPNRLRKWQWIKAAKMGTAIELETRHTVQVVEAPQGFLYYSQHLVFILREGQLSHHRKLQKK